MAENNFPKEEIYALKIDKNEKDIVGIGTRVSKNERDISDIQKNTALSDQKFQTLIDQLAGVPSAMNEMKETMLSMQSETKMLMASIQNDHKNTQFEVSNLRSELSNIKVEMNAIKEENNNKIKELNSEIHTVKNKTKFDIMDIVTNKIIPVLLGGGLVYFIMEVFKNLNQ